MDIKAYITKVTDKITGDKTLLEDFKSNPVKAVEKIIGKDLPDDVVNGVVSGVQAKIGADSAKDAVSKIKSLFSK